MPAGRELYPHDLTRARLELYLTVHPEDRAAGDRARTEAWFARYGRMPAELKTALAAAADIPVDIHPIFVFCGQTTMSRHPQLAAVLLAACASALLGGAASPAHQPPGSRRQVRKERTQCVFDVLGDIR